MLFIPLAKVDEEHRMVYGTAVAEIADRSGEIFDYESSKPHFEQWSGEFRKVTDGKSLGNLRAMHGSQIAVGKVTQIDFDDAGKKIDIAAQVVDDQEWRKVCVGVYTGFSVGGSYLRKWRDPASGMQRYTGKPKEISLADRPAIPSATFTMVKTDGSEEQRQFQKIDAAGGLKKSLYDVAELAGLLNSLNNIRQWAIWETQDEGDSSPIPEKLKVAIDGLAEILKEMVAEEAAELTQDTSVSMLLTDNAGALKKSGARNSKADQEAIQAIHDNAAKLGAICDSGMTKGDDDMDLKKVEETLTRQDEALKKLSAENEDLKTRLAKVESSPAPAKGALKVVGKGEDVDQSVVTEKSLEPLRKADGSIDQEATALELIKQSYREPMTFKVGQ